MLIDLVVQAAKIIVSDFEYTRLDGVMIKLPGGTNIIVDPCEGIACHGDDHFTIEEYEYVLSFDN